jgi:hypothetical protein
VAHEDNEGNTRLTEKELVMKANLAIQMMGLGAADKPVGERLFVGAQRMARGGILYLMSSVEAVSCPNVIWTKNMETVQSRTKSEEPHNAQDTRNSTTIKPRIIL